MNVLNWASTSVRNKGFGETVKIVGTFSMDLLFDWRYGTDTMRWIQRGTLGAESENLAHSCPYKATKTRPFLALLRQLQLPRDCHFVDIGAGKGRVLLMAAQYGFRKVVGIEFSAPLCRIARKNVELYSRKHLELSPIKVIEADATKHDYQPEDRVFFMFNPFDQVILAQVLAKIRNSLEWHPRKVWLLYNDPVYHSLVMQSGCFKSSARHLIGGTHFEVYTN